MLTPTPASRIQANLQDLFQANLTPGEAYIRFKLTADITALLSMKQVRRSIIVEAEKITPMPGMPESVIGIMSSGDRVFCVFDLARLLISARVALRRQYQIIVLQTDTEPEINIGLAVTELQGIIRFSTDKINSPPQTLPLEIAPYVSKVLQQTESVIPILDFKHILTAINMLQ